MIYDHRTLQQEGVIESDVCIVGSGAGGSAVATDLSQKGYSVVVIESGQFFKPSDFTQREDEMYPELFYDSGGRRTKNKAIRVMHGRGMGGSTLHNINLCKRAPDALIESWQLENFKPTSLAPHYDRVEEDLHVRPFSERDLNRNNHVFKVGVSRLGYKGGFLQHNRKDCVRSGFCELGCAFDAKMNAMRIYLPMAVKNGARIFADTWAQRFEYSGRKITTLRAIVKNPNKRRLELRFKAKVFVSSAGAIESPVLLKRSDLPNPHRTLGTHLHLHPGVAVAGVFDKSIRFWKGIPQSFECTEFLSFEKGTDKRIWITTAAAHPVGAAALLPGYGEAHSNKMKSYPYLSAITAMVHDETRGEVRLKGDDRVEVDYVLEQNDRDQLSLGIRECAKILFAGGAKEVWIPMRKPIVIRDTRELSSLTIEVKDHEIDLVAVHPMGSVRMGDDKGNSCVDTSCRYHEMDNLFIADASVYPTSLGVPPQLSTYAMGFFAAAAISKSGLL